MPWRSLHVLLLSGHFRSPLYLLTLGTVDNFIFIIYRSAVICCTCILIIYVAVISTGFSHPRVSYVTGDHSRAASPRPCLRKWFIR
ncbi:hypothetical protein P692DRAFT_20824068 [Suillus brevipes Sb2]|nr:hypothetical protein P692DRAFT_20824068 [Suillus brevipes Sb2]